MIDLKFLSGKKIVVCGLGRSGLATIKSALSSNVDVIATDDSNDTLDKISKSFPSAKVQKNIENIKWNDIDYLILSPGVPLTFPKPHRIVKLAKKNNCKIISDIELAYLANVNSKFIGITGTNGKSTTTSLIGHIFKEAGIISAIGGNIGVPILELENLHEDGVYVIEMSSYQLDIVDKTKFNVSILLNITPDHIDRHGNLENYIEAKKRIFRNQTDQDLSAICIDDINCKNLYEELVKESCAKLIAFSVKNEVKNGISIIGNNLIDNIKNIEYKLPKIEKLSGKHNAQNILAAYITAGYFDIEFDCFIKHASSFAGLKHRMQILPKKNNILFVNDSKATNADSAAKALETFDNIYWILGGVAKEGGIDNLEPLFCKVEKAYLIGQSQDDFAKILKGKVLSRKFNSLNQAVEKAYEDASLSTDKNAVILFSPACASFDQWPNFEQRGNEFIEIVNSL